MIDSVPRDDNSRLVYSTDSGGKCPTCGWPQRNCQCSTQHGGRARIPARITAKLRIEKSGRGGKTVTVIDGLPDNHAFLKELSQKLKRACGVGGTVAETGVELQGDVRDRVRAVLLQLGYTVKG
jgi:translation initiation factor 1